jgi:hypothetical protein
MKGVTLFVTNDTQRVRIREIFVRKGKGHPVQATESLEGELRYSSTHSGPRR